MSLQPSRAVFPIGWPHFRVFSSGDPKVIGRDPLLKGAVGDADSEICHESRFRGCFVCSDMGNDSILLHVIRIDLETVFTEFFNCHRF